MAALTAIHDFCQTDIALVGDIAAVDKYPILLVHALQGTARVIKMAGPLDHIFTILCRRMCIRSKIEEIIDFLNLAVGLDSVADLQSLQQCAYWLWGMGNGMAATPYSG